MAVSGRTRVIFTKISALLVLLAVLAPSAKSQSFSDSRFFDEPFLTGLSAPIGFAWLPDGRMLIWEKAGKIRIWKNGQLLGTPFLDISSRVNSAVDRGLIGLAVDPEFNSNGFIYLSYVYEPTPGQNASTDPRTQRVVRVKVDPANPDRALPDETVILGASTNAPCADPRQDCSPNNRGVHTIDHLEFGPDGKLYVSLGDGGNYGKDEKTSCFGLYPKIGSFDTVDPCALRAQDLDSLNGKILRINKDGTAPPDNPFFNGDPRANRSKVWAYGLRNPFRFTIDPRNGQVWIGDVGWVKWEEINRGRAGANYGWPCVEGPEDNLTEPTRADKLYRDTFEVCKNMNFATVDDAFYMYSRPEGQGSSITMGDINLGGAFPAEYQGNIFYADFEFGWMKRVTFDGSGAVVSKNADFGSVPRVVYAQFGPDGNLYYINIYAGAIRRIKSTTGTGNKPPVLAIDANPKVGLSPLTVNFSSGGSSDPEGGPLTYLWDFGDGQTSTAANPSHTYTATGVKNFTATLTLTDNKGASATGNIAIQVGNRSPAASISAPAGDVVVAPGTTVNFTGSGTDPDDGALAADKLKWTIILHHNDHTHDITTIAGASGSFKADDHEPTFYYEIKLTVTDSAGATASVSRRVDVQTGGGTPPPSAPFTMGMASGSNASVTINHGQTATWNIAMTPQNGFTGSVALTCSGAPQNSTCTVTPNSVNMANGATTVAVAVKTDATASASLRRSAVWAFALLGFGGMVLLPFSSRSRRALLMLVVFAGVIGMAACGGGNGLRPVEQQGSPLTPAGTYTIKVSGTSGSTTQSQDLTLIVN